MKLYYLGGGVLLGISPDPLTFVNGAKFNLNPNCTSLNSHIPDNDPGQAPYGLGTGNWSKIHTTIIWEKYKKYTEAFQ